MQDFRLAFRALRATPIVSVVAVLSLALGIGANTAIFSLVDSLLLRMLPVREPQRLMRMSTGSTAAHRPSYSYATFDALRRHGQSLDGAFAYKCCGKIPATIGASAETVDSQFVSGDFFATLGVPAILGRILTPADDVTGGGPAGPVAVISYRFWQRRFAGAASVVGSQVTIERLPVTVVGVTPPGFLGVDVGRAFDIAFPIRIQPLISPSIPFTDNTPWLNIVVRLQKDQSAPAATAALRAVQPQIRAEARPRSSPSPEFMKDPIVLEPSGAGSSDLRQRFERPLLAIFAVVALVLLIACANVANLQLARGAARRRELSVRLALGASRWRLARPLLIESAVLAAMGAALGLVFAAWASRALVAQISTETTRVVLDLSLDWRVLAFTGATLIAAVLIFGIAPAFRAASIAPIDALKEHGAASGRGSGRRDALGGRWSLGSTLVVGQVAVSLALVVAAGLFIRTFERLAGASLGFDRDRVLMVTLSTPSVPAAARNAIYHRLVSAAAASPGVAHAGGSINPPLVGTINGDLVVARPGEPVRADAETISQANFITPGWLAAYGTAIRDGRDIDEHDTMATPQVILVNDAFVRRFAAGGTVVGTAFALTARIPPSGDFPLGSKTVVGVVGDAVYRSIREPARPTIYFPLAQRDDPLLFSDFFIAVRTASGSPPLLMRSLTAALTEVNRDVTLSFRPVADQVTASIAQDRLVAMLSGFFGALALLLAGLGLYGVTAYAVALRRAEIGIRMALGAAPAGVVRLVLSRVSRLVGAGVLVGAAISLAASTLIGSLLYGVEPRDPLTLAGAALTLAAVGGLAAWLPAYRASRVDPAEVLREG